MRYAYGDTHALYCEDPSAEACREADAATRRDRTGEWHSLSGGGAVRPQGAERPTGERRGHLEAHQAGRMGRLKRVMRMRIRDSMVATHALNWGA